VCVSIDAVTTPITAGRGPFTVRKGGRSVNELLKHIPVAQKGQKVSKDKTMGKTTSQGKYDGLDRSFWRR